MSSLGRWGQGLAAALGFTAATGAFGGLATFENRALFGEETSTTADARPIVDESKKNGAYKSPSERKAFLVGADDYVDAFDLACVKNDVEALAARLLELGFEEKNITVLKTGGNFDDFPTKAHIEERFTAFVENLQSGDFVVVYLSGHGIEPTDSKESFFAPIDVKSSDPFGTSVSIDKMLAALEASDANFRWLIVDACRNDPANARAIFKTRLTTGAKGLTEIGAAPKATSLLQSCQPGKFSYEGGDGKARDVKNGFFTLSLLEALDARNPKTDVNGDGVLAFSEMLRYVLTRTNELAFEYYGQTQKPNLRGAIKDFALLEGIGAGGGDNGSSLLNVEGEMIADEWTWTRADEAGERKTLIIDEIEYAFRWCPPGTFMMGSPEYEVERDNDEQLHKVELTRGFWMLETEVTQEMWRETMGENPSRVSPVGAHAILYRGMDTSKYPVENVNWNDCQKFLKALNKKDVIPKGFKFRLPTEAEWEYACRAGTQTPFYWGSNGFEYKEFVNNMRGIWGSYGGLIRTSTNVGSYESNVWGLYDMIGNVAEWTQDIYAPYSYGAAVDPRGAETGSLRVVRGESFLLDAAYDWERFRSANRNSQESVERSEYVGLRIVLVAE